MKDGTLIGIVGFWLSATLGGGALGWIATGIFLAIFLVGLAKAMSGPGEHR